METGSMIGFESRSHASLLPSHPRGARSLRRLLTFREFETGRQINRGFAEKRKGAMVAPFDLDPCLGIRLRRN